MPQVMPYGPRLVERQVCHTGFDIKQKSKYKLIYAGTETDGQVRLAAAEVSTYLLK